MHPPTHAARVGSTSVAVPGVCDPDGHYPRDFKFGVPGPKNAAADGIDQANTVRSKNQ